MSQIVAREGHVSPLTRQHWAAERVLDWAGIGATHIRPTWFAEMLLLCAGPSIADEGKIYLPFGDGKHVVIAILVPIAAGWLLLISSRYRRIIDGIPQHWFAGHHALRIVFGYVFLALFEMGELPAEFALSAGICDRRAVGDYANQSECPHTRFLPVLSDSRIM